MNLSVTSAVDFDVTHLVCRERLRPSATHHRFAFKPSLAASLAGGGVPSLLSLAACAVLNSDADNVLQKKERKPPSDPRAHRLGITRKRKRGPSFKELAFAEWVEQTQRELPFADAITIDHYRCDVDLCSDSDDDMGV